MRPQGAAALAGIVAVGVAIAVGELAAGLVAAIPSPVDAIGQTLIPRFPGSVTSWAIDTFGVANRAVLTSGIVLVALLIGAYAGTAGRRHLATPVLLFGGFAALGVLTSQGQPGAAVVPVTLGLGVAAAAGLVLLRWILARVDEDAARALADARDTQEPGTSSSTAPSTDGTVVTVPRRTVVATAGVAALGAVVAGSFGRWVLGGGVTAEPSELSLPRPQSSLPPVTPAVDASGRIEGLSPILTPTDRFFRIDTALSVPRVDPSTWSLRVSGMVDRPLELSLEDLLAEPMSEIDATIACVSNPVGGDLIGTARWLGTPLADLLDRAGVQDAATQIVGRSVDGWTAGFPTELAFDGRDAIVAIAMNGEPLPARHGFPARLIVPGLFGYVSATKWLQEIELTTWEGFDAYWVPRGWAKEGPVKTGARIDVPRLGERLPAGEVVVAGVAWAPIRGIRGVEVRVDDGPFQPAELIEPLSDQTWVQWTATVAVPQGDRSLQVRAIDGDGVVQPQGPRPPAPDGAEGWHRRSIRVGD